MGSGRHDDKIMLDWVIEMSGNVVFLMSGECATKKGSIVCEPWARSVELEEEHFGFFPPSQKCPRVYWEDLVLAIDS